MRSTLQRGLFFAVIILISNLAVSRGAVPLDALGLYLTKNGYGGAPLVHLGNYYHLLIRSNGKPGNLLVDTGSPTTLLYRSRLKGMNLTEFKTTERVIGVFGSSRDVYGLTTIKVLTAGNCTMINVPVAVASDSSFSRPHEDGLLGLVELIKFGGVLDLRSHLVYLRPSRPGDNVGAGIKSVLSRQGYTAVPLLLKHNHLFVAGALNGAPCHFMVDSGSDLTALSADFVARANLKFTATPIVLQGFGGSSSVGMTKFPSLRIGNYEIRNGSASVARFIPQRLGGADSEIAGILGAEYLAINRAIFDFGGGTLYLRPPTR